MSKPTYGQVHIDVALTRASIAYTPGEYIGLSVFPGVPVEKPTGKYFIYTKADWLRDEAQVRAQGTRAQRGGFGITNATYTCIEWAFAQGVPDEIVDNADNPLRPLDDATRFTTEKIFQRQEKDVAALVFGNSIWSGSATPATLWSNDTSDPLTDIETAVNSVASTIFREPNTGVIGRGLWRYLKNHPDVVDRIKYSAGPNSPAIVTLNAIAALGGLEAGRLYVGGAGEDTGPEGGTSTLAYIWGLHMFVGYVAPRASLLTPSAGYIFEYKSREVSRFREDQERQYVVETRANWDAVVTASDAGYLIKSAA